jgi:putative ABC transport system ATP-binding protein
VAEPLRAIDVSYRVEGRLLLHDVNLEVHPGQRFAITGPSGVGKTSLLNILAGLIRPDDGAVRLGDQPLSDSFELRKQVAVIFQGYGLLSLLSAAENVEIALYARGVEANRAAELARSALSRVGLLPWRNHLSQELSGGQQQRIAIARALAVQPALLLADEPTAEQDQEHRTLILDALSEEASRGAIIVLATHDPDIAIKCDRELALGRS